MKLKAMLHLLFPKQSMKGLLYTELVVLHIFFLFLISCSSTGAKENKNSDSATKTKSASDLIEGKQQIDINCEDFIEVRTDFKIPNALLKNEAFYKFQLIPYRMDAKDHMRLYVVAQDKKGYQIGDPFFVSSDGKDDYPWDEIAIIKYPGLALFKKDILESGRWPKKATKMELVPIADFEYEKKAYRNYSVSFDGQSSELQLKPSPPAERVLNKIYSTYFPKKSKKTKK